MEEYPIYVVADPEAHPTFGDSDGAAILQYGRHPELPHLGWTLSYEEPDGNGVDSHFIPGPQHGAPVDQARDHLRWVWSAGGRP